jgi:Restriction endonuclease EcoRV
METETFLTALQEEARTFTEAIATEQGDWIIKGFIDIFKRIYTISVDTKVVSKVLELLLFPKLLEFAGKHDFKLVLAPEQNFYPDLTFVSNTNVEEKYAVCTDEIDEQKIYTLEDLGKISSVIKDFTFFAQPKYKIASALPGSGNTKNIGSVTFVDQLLKRNWPFCGVRRTGL